MSRLDSGKRIQSFNLPLLLDVKHLLIWVSGIVLLLQVLDDVIIESKLGLEYVVDLLNLGLFIGFLANRGRKLIEWIHV